MATKAISDSKNQPRRKLALIIGISKYEDGQNLPNPENDATKMSSALKEIGFLIHENRPIINATCDQIEHILIDFRRSIKNQDIIVFYFAGHGRQWEDQNYLIPTNNLQEITKNGVTTRVKISGPELKDCAINAQDVLNSINKNKPFATIFFLDCCRTYYLRNDELRTRSEIDQTNQSQGFKSMSVDFGSLIVYACAPGTVASDGNKGEKNGLFTKYLLEHIKIPNKDILTMIANVTREVHRESKGTQIPHITGVLSHPNLCFFEQDSVNLSNLVEIKNDDLELIEEIGSGGFGIVHRAIWLTTDSLVAVKKLHPTYLDKDSEKIFLKELALLNRLRHPHIVTFYGACLENKRYALVMEYMSLGSLYQLLHKEKIILSWPDRLSAALQAAKGINYLHRFQPQILHRDIKSLNFLLEKKHSGYLVKICDFGMAKTRNETTRRTAKKISAPITIPWTAPEILNFERYTNKSDIYSLGIVYWELASNEEPYDGHHSDNIQSGVIAGRRLPIPINVPLDFGTIIKRCWTHEPSDRPDCTNLIQMIDECIQNQRTDHSVDNNSKLSTISIKSRTDEDCDKFDPRDILDDFCATSDVNINGITAKRIQTETGSGILETKIDDKFESDEKRLRIIMICYKLTDELRKELGKMKVFFMFMGPIKSLSKIQKHRSEIKLNPRHNRIYAPGYVYWQGSLNDGKNRGNQPYYCPVGWQRKSFCVTEKFYEKFKGWCICYHGTKFEYGLSILLSGLIPAQIAAHGNGIYVIPSINYACHPRFAEVKLIEAEFREKFFKSGKYIQFVLECRVHPSNIKQIGAETLSAKGTIIDSNIDNNVIEWVIDNHKKDIVNFNDPDASIICTGVLIRITDEHPGLLPESQWWYKSHLCNSPKCCSSGIDINSLSKQNQNGVKCNIIYN